MSSQPDRVYGKRALKQHMLTELRAVNSPTLLKALKHSTPKKIYPIFREAYRAKIVKNAIPENKNSLDQLPVDRSRALEDSLTFDQYYRYLNGDDKDGEKERIRKTESPVSSHSSLTRRLPRRNQKLSMQKPDGDIKISKGNTYYPRRWYLDPKLDSPSARSASSIRPNEYCNQSNQDIAPSEPVDKESKYAPAWPSWKDHIPTTTEWVEPINNPFVNEKAPEIFLDQCHSEPGFEFTSRLTTPSYKGHSETTPEQQNISSQYDPYGYFDDGTFAENYLLNQMLRAIPESPRNFEFEESLFDNTHFPYSFFDYPEMDFIRFWFDNNVDHPPMVYHLLASAGNIGHKKTLEKVLPAESKSFEMRWNECQLWLERISPLPLVWAPLCGPIKQCKPGHTLLRYKCSCGRSTIFELPDSTSEFYLEFQETTMLYKGQISETSSQLDDTTQSPPSQPSNIWTTISQVTINAVTRIVQGLCGAPYRLKDLAMAVIFRQVPQPPTYDTRNVFLCCKPFMDKQTIYGLFSVASSTSRNDRGFYRLMRQTYKELRGIIASFSLREVTCFKFVQFEPFYGNHVSCSENEQLPDENNKEYEIIYGYRKVGDPPSVPPIPPEVMLFHYYSPQCASDSEEQHLRFIPKRKVPGHPEVAWGLYVEEGLSVWKFWIIILLVTIGSCVFIGVWLHLHPGDLQNAFTPPSFAFLVVGTLLIAPEFVGYKSKAKVF